MCDSQFWVNGLNVAFLSPSECETAMSSCGCVLALALECRPGGLGLVSGFLIHLYNSVAESACPGLSCLLQRMGIQASASSSRVWGPRPQLLSPENGSLAQTLAQIFPSPDSCP